MPQVSQAVARFRRGETVYYVGLRSSTMMLEYGQRGVVHCDPEGECYDVLFDGHSRIVRFGHDDDWPLSELCRAPPPVLLAGRFTVGETLYYLLHRRHRGFSMWRRVAARLQRKSARTR